MSRRSLATVATIVLLTVLPLWLADAPKTPYGGEPAQRFAGADARAQQAITMIAPSYRPWFTPVFEPASGEITSLLFALQAAAGAGVIGYWLGVSSSRARRAASGAATSDDRAENRQDHHAD